MATTRLAPEMDIRQYVASLDLNPDNVFYQRVSSNNVSKNGAQWQITSPNKRSLLLSYAAVEWTMQVRHRDAADDNDVNWVSSASRVSMKPVFPFSNAMSSQTVSVNGNSLTVSQPKRFMEPLARMCVSKDESRTCYESEWWDAQGGNYPPSAGHIDSLADIDSGLKRNEDNFMGRALIVGGLKSGGAITAGVGVANLAATNAVTYSYQEPLVCPPFNPFAKVTSGLPYYMPWTWMSPVIPNIDRLEVDIQFNRLDAGIFNYRYAHATGNVLQSVRVNDTDAGFRADLLLYWYEIPSTISLPRNVKLQTWNMREFTDSIGDVANGVVTQEITGQLLQLRSVPTLITVHARRDNDVAAYISQASNSTSSLAIPGANANVSASSLDNFMEIVSFQVVLGDRPNVISATFTPQELYRLTLKNSKYMGFSLSFDDWVGRVVPKRIAPTNDSPGLPEATGQQQIQQSKAFVALQPKDIAEKISSGVFFPTSLQFRVTYRARSGAYGQAGNDLSYRMFTHVYTGKHWLEIEPDRAQYQEQNIPFEAARRAGVPSLVSDSSLGSVRDLADSAYTSRF